jgi:hypothetical protein
LVAVEIVRYIVIISAVVNTLLWNYISVWASITIANLPTLRPLVFKKSYLTTISRGKVDSGGNFERIQPSAHKVCLRGWKWGGRMLSIELARPVSVTGERKKGSANDEPLESQVRDNNP